MRAPGPMRVHVAEQPLAQLMVRGLMPFDACRSPLKPPGRVAIVGPAKAPSHDDFARIARHPRLARVIASQGWTSLADIAALPRGVVGTVEVRTSRPVREVLLDPTRADRSPDDRIDITAAGGDGRHDPAAFVLPVWPDDHLWMFANPVELATPVTGVNARRGTLDEAQARAVADAERRARETALTRKATSDSERTRRLNARRAHAWLNELEVQRLAREARQAEAAARIGHQMERDMHWFAGDRFERRFQQTLARHIAHSARDPDAAGQVRVAGPVLQSLFPGEAWVDAIEFERRLRVHIRELARLKTRPRKPPHPLADLPYHLPRLARMVEIGAPAGIHIKYRRGRGMDAARRARLTGPVDEPEVIEQRADPHDPPDPRDYRPSF